MNNGNGTHEVPSTPKNKTLPQDLTHNYVKSTGQQDLTTAPSSTFYVQTLPIGSNTTTTSVDWVGLHNSQTIPTPTPINLYRKLHKIIKDGVRVGKNGRNDFHKYDYITEADVIQEVNKVFTENNLVYDFNVISVSQIRDDLTKVDAHITLVDLDSGESKIYSFTGYGHDKNDKGLYKAYTGLQKYFFMKNLGIISGDDPENDTGKANKPITKAPNTVTVSQTTIVKPVTLPTPKITTSESNTNVQVQTNTGTNQNGTTPVLTTTVNVLSDTNTFKRPKAKFSPPKRQTTETPREE